MREMQHSGAFEQMLNNAASAEPAIALESASA
jgi:hypothetical protein